MPIRPTDPWICQALRDIATACAETGEWTKKLASSKTPLSQSHLETSSLGEFTPCSPAPRPEHLQLALSKDIQTPSDKLKTLRDKLETETISEEEACSHVSIQLPFLPLQSLSDFRFASNNLFENW